MILLTWMTVNMIDKYYFHGILPVDYIININLYTSSTIALSLQSYNYLPKAS